MDTTLNMEIVSKYQQGDLFNSKNQEFSACVGDNGLVCSFSTYAYAYFEAGKVISNKIQDDPNCYNVNLLIYPLFFLYRHAIELSIKQLVEFFSHIYGENAIKYTHKIMDNWNSIKDELLPNDGYEIYVSFIDKVIIDLLQYDDNSMIFRYPKSKDNIHHLSEYNTINIENFCTIMIEIGKVFEILIFSVKMDYVSVESTQNV